MSCCSIFSHFCTNFLLDKMPQHFVRKFCFSKRFFFPLSTEKQCISTFKPGWRLYSLFFHPPLCNPSSYVYVPAPFRSPALKNVFAPKTVSKSCSGMLLKCSFATSSFRSCSIFFVHSLEATGFVTLFQQKTRGKWKQWKSSEPDFHSRSALKIHTPAKLTTVWNGDPLGRVEKH